MLENVGNAITRLPMDRLGRNLAGRIPSRSRHVRRNEVAMATAVAALDIQQLWAAGGRTPLDRLGRNLCGRIPSCSQYWKCYNSSYDGTNLDDS